MNIQIVKTLNKEKVLALNPTLVGVVMGVRFYEHPLMGDESTLIADTGSEFGLCDYWEAPTALEMI